MIGIPPKMLIKKTNKAKLIGSINNFSGLSVSQTTSLILSVPIIRNPINTKKENGPEIISARDIYKKTPTINGSKNRKSLESLQLFILFTIFRNTFM
ncbi:MAG: hypothetical protein HN802_06180 [Candidatus Jacksonbacteria bacterium]|nr:hypothetical protein [Candidatus Jacksonbacteria bacterium]